MKKFNLFDLIIICVIIGIISLGAWKFMKKESSLLQFQPYLVESLSLHLHPEVASSIHVGDKIIDSTGRAVMEIVELSLEDSYLTVFAADGKIHWSKHPVMKSVRFKSKILVPIPAGVLVYNRHSIKAGARVPLETNKGKIEVTILSVKPVE